MTITMNTSIFQGDLTSGPELAKDDLEEYVNLGILTKVDNHREHYAIQPCWIHDLASGVVEEINRNVLGRWESKLNAYVVAVKNIKNYGNSAGMNEDHRWLHVDVTATYYTFCPQEGQRLKGEIKKVGNRAAICIMFDVFTATVFAKDETEMSTWSNGDELRFEIFSFVHRRKGPIIRAKSISKSGGNKRKILAVEEGKSEEPYAVGNVMEDPLNESCDLDESRSSRKEKKKKKKIKIKQEVDDSLLYDDDANPQESNAWNHEDLSGNQDEDVTPEPDEEPKTKKKKKKKKSSRSE